MRRRREHNIILKEHVESAREKAIGLSDFNHVWVWARSLSTFSHWMFPNSKCNLPSSPLSWAHWSGLAELRLILSFTIYESACSIESLVRTPLPRSVEPSCIVVMIDFLQRAQSCWEKKPASFIRYSRDIRHSKGECSTLLPTQCELTQFNSFVSQAEYFHQNRMSVMISR